MSERMIEIQRARLLAANKGPRNHAPNGTAVSSAPQPVKQTPQQAAVAAVLTEDQLIDRFAQRLHDRDDSQVDSASAPTVPTALSRRILNRQGTGYIDGTVGAVVSAAADRFLATVLQQALACRNERLKGAELVRGAEKTRQRHWEQYEADAEFRRKRKLEQEEKNTQICHNAIKAAESLKKFPPATTAASSAGNADTPQAKKKKKKADDVSGVMNASRLKLKEDDESSVNSIDEEEACHRDYFGDIASGKKMDNDDEEDDTLILRDLSRPLEAWDFHVVGKEGLQPMDRQDDSEDESEDEEEVEAVAADSDDENGEDEDGDEIDGKSTPVPNASDKKKSSPASESKRKSTTSPPIPTPTPTELPKE